MSAGTPVIRVGFCVCLAEPTTPPDPSTRRCRRKNRGYRPDFRSSGNRQWSNKVKLNPLPSSRTNPQATVVATPPPLSGGSLDFNINAGRETQFIQFFNRLRCRLNDINQTLVSPNLVLLPRLLIHKRAGQYRVSLDSSRQRNWSVHSTMGTLCSIYNVLCTLVENRVIVRFHTNSNYFASSSRHRSITQKSVEGISRKANKNQKRTATNVRAEVPDKPDPWRVFGLCYNSPLQQGREFTAPPPIRQRLLYDENRNFFRFLSTADLSPCYVAPLNRLADPIKILATLDKV